MGANLRATLRQEELKTFCWNSSIFSDLGRKSKIGEGIKDGGCHDVNDDAKKKAGIQERDDGICILIRSGRETLGFFFATVSCFFFKKKCFTFLK